MHEASSGAAVCAFSRSGVSVPGIKYYEGRRAALKELSRRLERNPDQTTAAREIQRDWSAALEHAVERSAGSDWIAYRRGGVDALAELPL